MVNLTPHSKTIYCFTVEWVLDPAAVSYSIECVNGLNGRCESFTVFPNLNSAVVYVTFPTSDKWVNITLTSTGMCDSTDTSSMIANGAGE